MASTTVAYMFWLFFGWLGIHHLYLDRLNQAIVWFATCGGGFGIGWLRDLWKIPDYIEWCNGERSAHLRYLERAVVNPRPSCSWFRFAGMVVMGLITSAAMGALVPNFIGMSETDPFYYYTLKYTFVALVTLGNAVGVYLVANIGELQCSKQCPLIASICITPWLVGDDTNLLLASFLTALVTWYNGLQWRPITVAAETQRSRLRFCKNLFFYSLACAMWLTVVTAGIYFNASISGENGESIPVREAVNNFFKSDAWRQTKESLHNLFLVYWHGGPRRAWQDAKRVFDFSGEVNAFKVLGLTSNASQEEISKRCRKLSAENHPDRYKTQKEKAVAQEKFIEIQQACVSLSTLHARRSRNNKKSNNDEL